MAANRMTLLKLKKLALLGMSALVAVSMMAGQAEAFWCPFGCGPVSCGGERCCYGTGYMSCEW
jgi:hypothetical protein